MLHENCWAKSTRFAIAGIAVSVVLAASGTAEAFPDPATCAGAACTSDGSGALQNNVSGPFDSAFGEEALFMNTSGSGNTASGFGALENNTVGFNNVASGFEALSSNIDGVQNAASGAGALELNVSGSFNTADGVSALVASTGDGNIGLGINAGFNLTEGDNNIYIGNEGAAKESDTIRIGDPATQTATFVAGVVGNAIAKSNAQELVIDANGQLGVKVSSVRYKRDIRDMGDSSTELLKLRPVSFRYKRDPDGAVQYGLIAEEVAAVYPELVTRGPGGKILGVRYDLLPPMLLNEMQKLGRENLRKDVRIAAQQHEIDELIGRVNALERRVGAGAAGGLESAMR